MSNFQKLLIEIGLLFLIIQLITVFLVQSKGIWVGL